MSDDPESRPSSLRQVIAAVPGARALVRRVRHLPDRALHRWRRRRALNTVRRTQSARRIVVLCLGNINRSPFAAALLERRLRDVTNDSREVLSAGLIGPGRPSPPETLALAAARGLDLSSHRSRLVTAEMVRDAGLVIVMNGGQAREVRRSYGAPAGRVVVLGDLDEFWGGAREIRDPYDQDPLVYEASFARIERCVQALVGAVAGAAGRPTGRPGPANRWSLRQPK